MATGAGVGMSHRHSLSIAGYEAAEEAAARSQTGDQLTARKGSLGCWVTVARCYTRHRHRRRSVYCR
jgi:hypothetical protein